MCVVKTEIDVALPDTATVDHPFTISALGLQRHSFLLQCSCFKSDSI